MTEHVAVYEPSSVVTVIMAVPAATPVTTPAELTVATVVSLLVHAMSVSEASLGLIVAVRVEVLPTDKARVELLNVTPVTAVSPLLSLSLPQDVFNNKIMQTKIAELAVFVNKNKLFILSTIIDN